MSTLAAELRALIPLIDSALADHFPARVAAAQAALDRAVVGLMRAESSGLDPDADAARVELAPWVHRFQALLAHLEALRTGAHEWARTVSPTDRWIAAVGQLQIIIGSALAHPTDEEIDSAIAALEQALLWAHQHKPDCDWTDSVLRERWAALRPSIDRLRALAAERGRSLR
jgi:hypothetical protein